MDFRSLFEDEDILVIHKPSKIQTHITKIDPDKRNVIDSLQSFLGYKIYPIHRLDRGTSGCLLLSKNSESASILAQDLQNKKIKKIYNAIVRGPLEDKGKIDTPIKDPYSSKIFDGLSVYESVFKMTLDIEISKHRPCVFTFVEVEPISGRTHQIRKHFAKINRPIIGDMEYGDFKLNKYFEEKFKYRQMLLHSKKLIFHHPKNKKLLEIEAPLPTYFNDFIHLASRV